jgi:cell division protein FtsI (penicillin-binding protein 3)
VNALRIYLVAGFFVLLAVTMTTRVVFLHVFDKDFLQDQGDARTIRMERINAHRGMILDQKGKPMAVSSPVVSLWANPSELTASGEGMEQLALLLEVAPTEFNSRLEKNSNQTFVYLRRHLPPQVAEKILSYNIPGVYAEREYHRFYPVGEVAAHVVGFTDINDKGQEGVELAYDSWLQGTPGKKKVLKNLYGDIVRDIKPVAEASPGKNLELSLDLRLQYLAYRELKSAIQYYNASSGSVVILDVATGAILALVNQPSYNPNNRATLDLAAVRNRAVTDVFEPGSTVKPFTVAVALQSGRYTPQSTIDTSPGFIKVGKKTIPDPSNYGVLDLGGILEKSSQVGINQLAGFIPSHRRWKDIERATFAYGYGLTVTPLQLASAYLTIASGGLKRQISLISQESVTEVRVLEQTTATEVMRMLRRVTSNGTGSRASMDAYTVAGKTGTVRKVGEDGYQDTRHMAFFAGITPALSPRLVGVVMINEPKGDDYGGGAIAAPVFSKIMAGALRLLNVPPDDLEKAA